MTTQRKLTLTVTALGAVLLLGGCGSTLEETRAAFGYSGLDAGDPSLSSYEQARSDFVAARYGLAVKRFQLAMAEDPASVEAVNGLAASYDQLGRYDLSERYYRRALAMDPSSVQTLNNLGYSLQLQGKHDLALAFFRDAAQIDPDNGVIAANAERAVAGRLEDQDAALAEAPAAEPTPAPVPAPETGLRIVRLNAGEQFLQVSPRSQPAASPAPAGVSQGPEIPAVPLQPVETAPLPAPAGPELAPTPVALRPSVRVAAMVESEDDLVPAGPAEMRAPAVDLGASVVLANGNGRRHMAARMRDYLARLGLTSMRLANADHFAHDTTVITYLPGHRGLAEVVSDSLPVAPLLREVTDQAVDVRVRLGGDLLGFDRDLLQVERNSDHAETV